MKTLYLLLLILGLAFGNIATAQTDSSEATIWTDSVSLTKKELLESKNKTDIFYPNIKMDELNKYANEFGMMRLIDFNATWCMPCKMMYEKVFKSADVLKLTKDNLLSISLDVDSFEGMEWVESFGVKQLPCVLLFDRQGKLYKRYDYVIGKETLIFDIQQMMQY